MSIIRVLSGVSVKDFESASDWYGRLFGRPADNIPMPDEEVAEWHVSDTGWIQLIGDPDRAGNAMLTIGVDDLNGLVKELEAHDDIALGDVQETPGKVRTAIVNDVDGNMITFAEDLGGIGNDEEEDKD